MFQRPRPRNDVRAARLTSIRSVAIAALLTLTASAIARPSCDPAFISNNLPEDLDSRPTAFTYFAPDAAPASIIAAGFFDQAGPNRAWRIATTAGGTWSELGGGINILINNFHVANSLAVFPLASGEQRLWVSGNFSELGVYGGTAGSVSSPFLVTWNGYSWESPGTTNGLVKQLLVVDRDGPSGPGGPALFAAGSFTIIGDDPAPMGLAMFDGTSWFPVPRPELDELSSISGFEAVDEDGPGPASPTLFALLNTSARARGTTVSDSILRWNNGTWTPVGPQVFGGRINDIASFDPDGDGIAPRSLHAVFETEGSATVYRWNPIMGQWDSLAAAAGHPCEPNQLETVDFDGPSGPQPEQLMVATRAACGGTNRIYTFDGTQFLPLTEAAIDGDVSAFQMIRTSPGAPQELYVGAQLTLTARPPFAINSFRYDGNAVRAIPQNPTDAFARPEAITAAVTFDADGPGPLPRRLIIAEAPPDDGVPFFTTTNTPLWEWTGTTWQPYAATTITGNEQLPLITAMHEFDHDGPGPELPQLIIGGGFDTVNGITTPGLARYQPGIGWSALAPDGFPGGVDIKGFHSFIPFFAESSFRNLAIFGNFQAVNNFLSPNLIIWNGFNLVYESIPGTINGPVYDVLMYDPELFGSFPTELIIAGEFTTIGEDFIAGVARFNGTQWQPLEAGIGSPAIGRTLTAFNDKNLGKVLILGGNFSTIDKEPEQTDVLVWNPSIGWVSLGLDPIINFVKKVIVFDRDGIGPAAQSLLAISEVGIEEYQQDFGWSSIATYSSLSQDRPIALVLDDDASGPNPESVILGGEVADFASPFAASGLARFAQVEIGTVITATGNLLLSPQYICGIVPDVFTPVIFDYSRLFQTSPDVYTTYFLSSDFFINQLHVRSAVNQIDLGGNDLWLISSLRGSAAEPPSLRIGKEGNYPASLTLVNGEVEVTSDVYIQNDVIVGDAASAGIGSHNLTIDGDINFALDGDLRISPYAAAGSVEIRDALLNTTGNIRLAESPASVAMFAINNGTLWLAEDSESSQFQIGAAGYGRMVIDGETSSAYTTHDSVVIGDEPGSYGEFRLGDTFGGNWDHQGGDVIIGNQGTGLLQINNAASVIIFPTASVYVGMSATSSGVLAVTTTNTDFDTSLISGPQSINIGTMDGTGELYLGKPIPSSTAVGCATLDIGRNGTLRGTGAINVSDSFINRGTVRPEVVNDQPPAAILIEGNYQQLSASANMGIPGKLAIEISGPDSAGFLSIDGNASLGGQVNVTFADSYVPSPGELASGIDVVYVTGELTGRFEVANFPGLAPDPTGAGRFLRLENRAIPGARGNFTVTVIEDTLAEPIPSTDTEGQDYDIGGAGTAAALGDLDQDGDLDLVITVPDAIDPINNPGSIVILYNAGSIGGYWQGFTSTSQIAVGRNPSSVAIADFDLANGKDIVVACATDGTVEVLYNPGNGQFNPAPASDIFAVGLNPVWVGTGNFDSNPQPDIVTSLQGEDALAYLFNVAAAQAQTRGFGGLRKVPLPSPPGSGLIINYDNDKWDDTVVTQPDTNNTSIIHTDGDLLLRGIGSEFTLAATLEVGNNPVAISSGDLNLDNIDDLVIAVKGDNSLAVLLGDGTENFSAPLSIPAGNEPKSVAVVNLDGDADPDLAVITKDESDQGVVRIIRNDLFGNQLNFATQTDLMPGSPPSVVLAGDVSGDGTSDLVSVNNSGALLAARGVQTRRDVTVFTFALCAGDADNDRVVGMADITAIFANFLEDYSPGTGPGDANGDGVVTFADLTRVLLHFGSDCN